MLLTVEFRTSSGKIARFLQTFFFFKKILKLFKSQGPCEGIGSHNTIHKFLVENTLHFVTQRRKVLLMKNNTVRTHLSFLIFRYLILEYVVSKLL